MNMNINRHNYEEYFVLYLDQELSREERRQVEEFVAANPDLKEELDILEQSKLEPDTSIRIDKALLYRTEESNPVNHSNYEEYLLSYIDNELGIEEKMFVERFLEKNPAVQQELALFQQTVSQADASLVFPDKESLYRKEEPVARVVVMRWWKVAAAAAVLITAGLISYNTLFRTGQPGNDLAGSGQVVTAPANTSPDNNNSNTTNEQKDDQPADRNDQDLVPPVNPAHEAGVKQEGGEQLAASSRKKSAQGNQPGSAEANPEKKEPVLIAKVDNRPVQTTALTAGNNSLRSEDINKDRVTPDVAVTFNPPDAADKKIETVALDDEPNRKSRGLFRKATRVFERRTNINATDDEERLLIGGFVVKLK